MRIVNWYLGLGLGPKIVIGLALVVGFYLTVFFTVVAFLHVWLALQESSSPQTGATAPSVTTPEASSPTPSPMTDNDLRITSARWEGEKVVVKGTWKGDISSVQCDLFEGGLLSGRATDWWDRGVSAKMSWSGRTFTQNFIEAKGRKIEEPIDPASSYAVWCSAHFSGGLETYDTARVEGTPPG